MIRELLKIISPFVERFMPFRLTYISLLLSAILIRPCEARFIYSHLRNNESYWTGKEKKPAPDTRMPFLCFQALSPNTKIAMLSNFGYDVIESPSHYIDNTNAFVYTTSEIIEDTYIKRTMETPAESFERIASSELTKDEWQYWQRLEVNMTHGIDSIFSAGSHITLERTGDCAWIGSKYDPDKSRKLWIPHRPDVDPRIRLGKNEASCISFVVSGEVAVGGVLSALTDGIWVLTRRLPSGEREAIPCSAYAFPGLFQNMKGLKQIGISPFLSSRKISGEFFRGMEILNLPLTTGVVVHEKGLDAGLKYKEGQEGSYAYLFSGCSNLKIAEIPIWGNNPGKKQYLGIFLGCSSLESVSGFRLSGLLQDQCFESAFSECRSLKSYPLQGFDPVVLEEGNETNKYHRLGFACCAYMFSGCQDMRFKGDTVSITCDVPYGKIGGGSNLAAMFSGCHFLKKAELPGRSVPGGCYANLFDGCTNLVELHVGLTNQVIGTGTTSLWLRGTTTNGVIYCLAEALVDPEERGPNSVPVGWTIKGIE